MTPEKILCIGGPLAGDEIDSKGHYFESDGIAYRYCEINDWFNIYHCFGDDLSALFNTLLYGYEQHCKAVSERNKPSVFAQQAAEMLQKGLVDFSKYAPDQCTDSSVLSKELQDSYTASFLRSCRTVIVGNPFGEPTPITFTYGKHHLGEINDSLEFIARGEANINYGRIRLIAIIP